MALSSSASRSMICCLSSSFTACLSSGAEAAMLSCESVGSVVTCGLVEEEDGMDGSWAGCTAPSCIGCTAPSTEITGGESAISGDVEISLDVGVVEATSEGEASVTDNVLGKDGPVAMTESDEFVDVGSVGASVLVSGASVVTSEAS